MKKLTLILLFVAQPWNYAIASDHSDIDIPGASIEVSCLCSYYNQDGIEKIIPTFGASHSVTWKDVNGCLLENGKVVNEEGKTSCWKAKMNANWNCAQSARSTQPGRMRLPNVLLHEDTCYGAIVVNDKRVSENSRQ